MNESHTLIAGNPLQARPVVLQIGPEPGSNGGIATVIEETLKFESGRFEQRSCHSWVPNGKLASFPRAIRAAFTMFTSRRRWSIAHVHLSEYGSFLREGALILLARTLRRPAVATLHGANLTQHVAKYPRLSRAIFNSTTIVLCLGENQANIVARIAPNVPLRIVGNPIHYTAFPSSIPPAPPRRDQPTFVYAGEVGQRKGHDRLIRAWDTVLQEYPEARLRIAGPLAKNYEVRPQQGVDYLGNLDRKALLEEYSKATATVLPSRAEVLPMVLIESHAQGTPTVYTKVGEWQVFADAPGIRLVNVHDESEDVVVSSIAQAMIDLAAIPATDPTLLISWSRDRFSTQVVSNQLDCAYHAAISGENPSALHNLRNSSGLDVKTPLPTNTIGTQRSTEEI